MARTSRKAEIETRLVEIEKAVEEMGSAGLFVVARFNVEVALRDERIEELKVMVRESEQGISERAHLIGRIAELEKEKADHQCVVELPKINLAPASESFMAHYSFGPMKFEGAQVTFTPAIYQFTEPVTLGLLDSVTVIRGVIMDCDPGTKVVRPAPSLWERVLRVARGVWR